MYPIPELAITSKTIVSQGAALSGSVTRFAVNYVNNGTVASDIFAIGDVLPSIFDWSGYATGTHLFLSNANGGRLTGSFTPV